MLQTTEGVAATFLIKIREICVSEEMSETMPVKSPPKETSNLEKAKERHMRGYRGRKGKGERM